MNATCDRIHIAIYQDERGVEAKRNHDAYLPGLIGGLEITKGLMLQAVMPTNPFATHIRDMKHINANVRKKKVSKDEAMKIYMQLGKTIQQRLKAMQVCDDVAQFEIDEDLLKKL